MSRFLILLSLLTPAIAVFGFQKPVYADNPEIPNLIPEVVCVIQASGPSASVARIGWRTKDGAEHNGDGWGLPMGDSGYSCLELLTQTHPIPTHNTFAALSTRNVENIWIEVKVWGGPENRLVRCPAFGIQTPIKYWYIADTKWWSYGMACRSEETNLRAGFWLGMIYTIRPYIGKSQIQIIAEARSPQPRKIPKFYGQSWLEP